MKIIDFYKSLLADVEVYDEHGDGLLSALYREKYHPLKVEGKRLVLPTKDILRGGHWDERIVFHPMSEKLTRGEAPVLKALKDYMQLRITVVLSTLLQELMNTAASPEMHKKMGSAAAKQYLKDIPNADAKTAKALEQVLSKVSKDPDRRLITIYLKRGGKDKEEVRRSCIVSFPICDEFDNDSQEIFGVKMPRKTDKAIIAKLFDYVLGDKDVRESYSVGSNNLDAPYFHSLISAFYKIANRLTRLVGTHHKHLESADEMRFALDWAEFRDELAMFSGVIPDQEGNEGMVLDETGAPVKTMDKPNLQERAQEAFNNRPGYANARQQETPPWEDAPVRSREVGRPVEPSNERDRLSSFLDRLRGQNQPEDLSSAWSRNRPAATPSRAGGYTNGWTQHREDDRYGSRLARYDGGGRETLRQPLRGGRSKTL